MRYFGLYFLLIFLSCTKIFGQDSMPATPVVCYASEIEQGLSEILPEITDKSARTAASLTFIISYDNNVPTAAQAAIQKAADIWAKYLSSGVPIRIKVSWSSLSNGTLAVSGASKIFRNFVGAPRTNIWYPGPLAESLAGKDLNSGADDITVNLSSAFNWNYATDGKAVAGKYDLVSVVLHELAHGLGFSSTFGLNTSNSAQGQWGQSSSGTVFDYQIQDGKAILLTNTGIFGNPSTDLKTEMTSGLLYYILKNTKYKSNQPRLYAPYPYVEGTSISHLDESTYPSGNVNSLMSPRVQAGEVVQSPGDILLYIFAEMGWYVNNISVVTATENLLPTDYSVKVFPNPSSNYLNVAIPDGGKIKDIQLEILNQNGEIINAVQEKGVTSKIYQFDLSSFSAGIYLAKIFDGNNVTVKRFVKL